MADQRLQNAPYLPDESFQVNPSVRDTPPLVECNACDCSLTGHASPALVEQFQRVHDHGNET